MAMPDNELSSKPIPARMENDKEKKVKRRSDFELGGIALQDPSQGHLVQEWNCYITDDFTEIRIVAPAVTDTLLYTGTGITSVSCSFDQNMRPTFAFIEEGSAKLSWYDSVPEETVVTDYGATVFTPKVTLDDKRALQEGAADVIFAYVKNDNLYMRMQRDRYLVEYLLYTGIIEDELGELQCIGMCRNFRLGFQFRQVEDIEDI